MPSNEAEEKAHYHAVRQHYAGHIDLENVGYGGTPVNDRRYPNEKLATALNKAEITAQTLDRLDTARFGWRSTTSSRREPSASRTCCCWRCT